MANFKDFAKNYNKEQVDENNINKAKEVIDKYSSFSESELAMELAKTIKQQKDNNLYNRDSVLKQIESLSMYLSGEQQQKLKELLIDAENK